MDSILHYSHAEGGPQVRGFTKISELSGDECVRLPGVDLVTISAVHLFDAVVVSELLASAAARRVLLSEGWARAMSPPIGDVISAHWCWPPESGSALRFSGPN